MTEKYIKEIPEAIINNECTWLFNDYRMTELPKNVKRFLINNFIRYSPDLFVWGKKFKAGTMTDSFYAVKDGKYFVYPKKVIGENVVKINSQNLTSTIVDLKKGPNSLSYDVREDFYIIYLPANQERFKPKKAGQSTFVR